MDALPEARDKSHAAYAKRVMPHVEASAIDKRLGALPRAARFVRAAASRPPKPARAKLLRAIWRCAERELRRRAGDLKVTRRFYWWKEKIRPP